jgi:uncharacterized protein YidB (DUF937 family)
MGIFDEIMNTLGGGMGSGAGGGNPLLNIILQMLSGPNSGGLQGLGKVFADRGLKDQFDSWISTGGNLPVSADQMGSVFGDKLGDIAKQLGVSEKEAAGGLADIMPQVIDQLTPDGQIPASDQFSQEMDDLNSKL